MSKKPDYKNNPAINSPVFSILDNAREPEHNTQRAEAAPEGMRMNPAYIEKYIEKRTRRVQIIMQPSLYEKAKAKAEALDKSFNDYIHELLERDVNK